MKEEAEKLRLKVADLRRKCGQLEMSVKEIEGRFLKIFHASSNMMAITALNEGRIIDVNEAAASHGGYKREDLIGHLPKESNLSVDADLLNVMLRKLKQDGCIRNLQTQVRNKDGAIRTILVSADPIVLDGEPCVLSVSVDVTALEEKSEALRKSEEKYRRLVEDSLQGVAIIQDMRYVFCNTAFSRMTGYTVEELLSLAPEDMGRMIHPEDRNIVRSRYQDRLAGKPVTPYYEYRGIRKDGTELWLEVYATLGEYNGKSAMQLVYLDITERKQAEKALRESEERFRLIAETIDEVFWIFDPEKGAMTYLSPVHERIWGYPREPLYKAGSTILDMIHPDDREQVISSLAAIDAGQFFKREYRIIRPDGSIRYIRDRGFPVKDKEGKLRFYVGVGQDVTEYRLAEEAIRESKDYLNQIINCIGDPIFVKDREHKFTLVNKSFSAYFNASQEKLIGDSSFGPTPEELVKSIWEAEEEVFETGRESITEDNHKDRRGATRTLMTKKSPLTGRGGDKQIIGVMRDITEYKQLESQFLQAQKMEAIGILAGGVAHDFNNLLNVINGYSELVLDDLPQDSPIRKDLEQVREAGRRAASLTSQLLAFGRKQMLLPEVLNLNTVISEMNSMLRHMVGENIELTFIAQPDLRLVNADPGQIQQIVMNLVVNARDAMPQGGKLIIETSNVDLDEDYIRRHSMVNAGPYVMLAITDTGLGMDAETQSHLFEPFFTTKQKGKGTGLGLSTVYGIVKQSDGFIWVYSEPGRGTAFKIYLPQTTMAMDVQVKREKPETAPRGSETVLVVEDEAAVRELTVRILRERGYHVLEAADGQEALKLAHEYPGEIELVLTDVVMPAISGTTLVARLSAVRPKIKSLFVSGYTDNAVIHHGILEPNAAFLQKPFTMETLMRKIREVLSQSPG
ncbi:MAG: PAS domain S-box protein [Acidobacteria bacterium]|nr:PAS domain S-box protein [Acidobacteriota bacterium]